MLVTAAVPAHRALERRTGDDLDAVGDDERRQKPDAELSDQGDGSIVVGA